MAILIPRGKEFWLRRPTGLVELNYSKELADGLSLATIFDGSNRELVLGREISAFGDTFIDGEGANFDEVGDYITIPSVVLNSKYSITTAPKFTDNSGIYYQYFLSFGTVASVNSLNMYLFEASASNAADRNDIRYSASNANPGSASAMDLEYNYPDHNGEPQSIVVSGGASAIAYLNGRQEDVSSGSYAMADGTTRTLYLGGRSDLNASRFFGGSLPYVYAHNRALLADETDELHEAPYEILRRRRRYFVLGAGSDGQNINPDSIPTQENFGNAALSPGVVTLTAAAISSAEIIGTLTASAQAFIDALGLVSNEAFGSPSVLPGAAQVQSASLPSSELFGVASLQPGAVTVDPASINSAEAMGSPLISTGALAIQLAAIATAESFGVSTVVPDAVSIQANAISSAESVGNATLQTGSISLQLNSIGSGEQFGTAGLQPGLVAIEASSIPSDEVVGDLTLLSGGTMVTLVSIASDEAHGMASISPGSVSIDPVGLNSAEQIGAAQVVPGLHVILPTSISSLEQHGDALIFNGSAIISPAGIVSGEQIGAVTLIGGADVIGWLTARIEAHATLQAAIKTDPALMGLSEVNRVH